MTTKDPRTALLRWRTRLRLSQRAGAKRIGISQQMLCELERGGRNPSGNTRKLVLAAAGVPLSWWEKARAT